MAVTGGLTELLGRLDRIQRQLSDLNGRLRRGPILLKSQDASVRQLVTQLETIQGKQQQLILEAKGKEKQSNEGEAAIARRKSQLSEAKTNKEYQALKSQIATDETASAVLAEEALEAMEISEKFRETVAAAEAEVAKAQQLFEKTRKTFAEEEPSIRAEIERCTTELNGAESELSRDFREIYNRLVRSHGGDAALALVVNRKFCGGCNQTLPIHFIAQVIQGKPICCSSCGRLLYVPDDFEFEKG